MQRRISSARKSSSNDKDPALSKTAGGSRRWPLFSSFKKLDDTPPAITAASVGAPFEYDVEKGVGMETMRGRDEGDCGVSAQRPDQNQRLPALSILK